MVIDMDINKDSGRPLIIDTGRVSTSINDYSVWMEVNYTSEDGKESKILIHPKHFKLFIDSMNKAKELAALSGEEAIPKWMEFVASNK